MKPRAIPIVSSNKVPGGQPGRSSPPEDLTGCNLGASRYWGAFVCGPSLASTLEVEILS